MSVNEEESLSADEIRQKLYQTFKSRGLLDSLKTQLRNQLIQELQQPVRTRRTVLRSASAASSAVLATACNSVMIDHLKSIGCEYTLSVFYPECGMSKDKVLSSRDLLQLMKISPHMPLYKAVMSNLQKGQTGFLMTLFTEVADHLHGSVNCDAASQTSAEDAHKESLVEKMQMIEQEYERVRNREDRWTSVEAKLTQHRRDIEEQAQVELKAKLQHFMDVEITKVKREEQEKSRKEILELRRDMERTHELRSEALVSRERNAIQRLQKHQEMEEKELYTQRQMLLKDIESVRHRETEVKRRTEAFEKSCKFHEEKMKTVEDLMRRRELSVKNTEDSFQQKLKSEVMKYQLELKEDYMKRTEMLAENEKKNKVESVGLQKEWAVIEAKAEEHERSLSEVKRLLMELETLRGQKRQLEEKLDDMRDYSELKRQTLEHQTQIRLTRQQLEENRRLAREVSGPSEEQLRLQAELQRLQTARRRDEEEFETQKNVLHTQLQHEVQKCALLKAQLMECEERTRWMNANAEEIQLQLKHTQQGVTLRAPRCRVEAPERDSELLSGALTRIRELEIEADRLEDAYRTHQQRADASRHRTTTSTSYIKPRVTFSGALDPHQPLGRPPSGDQTPPRLGSPPARRLSSTPVSISRPDAHQTHPVAHDRLRKTDTEGPAVMFTDLRTDRQISPIPPADSRDLTSVSSPTMKSTTRDHSSPPRLQQMISSPSSSSSSSSSSQGSSSQPEKISLHDLTDPEPLECVDQECILEKLQDTHTQRCLRDEAVPSSDAREEEERPEEREDERLEQELEIQHEKEAEEEHVTGAASVIGGRDEEAERVADVINPLEKYMMILTQGKPEQSPKKESDRESPQEEHLLSEINDDSIDAVSHEEPDEEFW
ncbi:centriole and centriolar satellite protein ofd1 isoform X5 [Triplophysa rosa]|uniref:centriole and centriolar satellite protein ofd1 isoform X5 n=1 Tax=Triplophysa rosa TaxID=992332 RepID=UPI0025460B1D|nr:centriole and centriolar satellite protein ofd1 isoform X5 [Triplophysa rosa]